MFSATFFFVSWLTWFVGFQYFTNWSHEKENESRSESCHGFILAEKNNVVFKGLMIFYHTKFFQSTHTHVMPLSVWLLQQCGGGDTQLWTWKFLRPKFRYILSWNNRWCYKWNRKISWKMMLPMETTVGMNASYFTYETSPGIWKRWHDN